MAITVTDRGSGSASASSTAYAINVASNCTAGAAVVLSITADNSASGGTPNNINSVTDSLGNTWTKRVSPLYDPGAANAGIQGAIFDTDQAVGTITTSTTITVNFGASTTAKGHSFIELAPESGYAMGYVTGGVGTGAGTATPTVTTGTITVGDVVIGSYHSENVNATTGDSDTTNGSWSSQVTTTVGSGTSGIRHSTQYKTQTTSNSTQTFNPTTGSAQDCILSWVQYRQTPYTNAPAGLASGTGAAYGPAPALAPSAGLAQGTGLAGGDYRVAILAESPVSYWRLGETSGTNADDLGSAGTDGTYTGGYTLGATGALTGDADKAVDLNGTTGYVAANDVAAHSFAQTGAITVIAWAKADSVAGPPYGIVVSHGRYIDGVNDTLDWGIRQVDTAWRGTLWSTTGTRAEVEVDGPYSAATWYMLAITADETTDTLILYVNGSEVGRDTTWSGASAVESSGTVDIGRKAALVSSNDYFPGIVDEVAIFGTVLSASKIASLYSIGMGAGGGASAAIGVLPPAATATGESLQPTVEATGGTNAPAELASATGLALAASITLAVTAGLASGVGTAYNPTVAIGPAPSVATGTGQALGATTIQTASAGLASGTGTAYAGSLAITFPAELASGTGEALQPSVSTVVETNAPAQLASGTGAALSPTTALSSPAGLASASGAALAAAPDVGPSPPAATGSGAALTPTVSTSFSTGLASGTGTAYDATVSTVVERSANAELASGTGQANTPVAALTSSVGLASGTGSAYNATVAVGADALAGLASGTGTAYDASLALSNTSGLASGVGLAQPVVGALEGNTSLAAGSGSAYPAGVLSAFSAGMASGTGVAYNPTIVTGKPEGYGFPGTIRGVQQADLSGTAERAGLSGSAEDADLRGRSH